MHTLKHNYRPEVYVPWGAISDNANFALDKTDGKVQTADGKTCQVMRWKSINILSDQGKEIISRLYGIDHHTFLDQWSDRLYGGISELYFVWMELDKPLEEE